MKPNKLKMLRTALLLVLVACVLAFWSCNRAPSKSDTQVDFNYRLDGIFAKDPNLYSCRAEAVLLRNDSVLSTALITIGDDTLRDTLRYSERSYSLSAVPAVTFSPGVYDILVEDSTFFLDTIQTTLVDNFSFTVTDLPPTHDNQGGESVLLSWQGSLAADGYVVAAVPRYQAYSGLGYSGWIGDGSSEGEIPAEAFRWSDGLNPDTGWYFVYVYAFTGAPDSGLSANLLPVPLPEDLDDNIAEEFFVGRFGTVTVALRDSVHVVTQQ